MFVIGMSRRLGPSHRIVFPALKKKKRIVCLQFLNILPGPSRQLGPSNGPVSRVTWKSFQHCTTCRLKVGKYLKKTCSRIPKCIPNFCTSIGPARANWTQQRNRIPGTKIVSQFLNRKRSLSRQPDQKININCSKKIVHLTMNSFPSGQSHFWKLYLLDPSK